MNSDILDRFCYGLANGYIEEVILAYSQLPSTVLTKRLKNGAMACHLAAGFLDIEEMRSSPWRSSKIQRDFDHIACFDFLVDHDANIEALDGSGSSILILAILSNRDKLANHIISKCPKLIDICDARLNAPISHAVSLSKNDLIDNLIANGCDLRGVNRKGLGLAHMAKDPEVLRRVLSCGLDPNIPDLNGMTPFHHAVLSGNPRNVETLFSFGGTPFALDKKGRLPEDLANAKTRVSKAAMHARMIAQEHQDLENTCQSANLGRHRKI